MERAADSVTDTLCWALLNQASLQKSRQKDHRRAARGEERSFGMGEELVESALIPWRLPKNRIFYQFFPQPNHCQLSKGLFPIDQTSHYSLDEFRSQIRTKWLMR